MKQKKLLMLIAMVLVVVLCASVLTACKKDKDKDKDNKDSKVYTYRMGPADLPTSWNYHTYQIVPRTFWTMLRTHSIRLITTMISVDTKSFLRWRQAIPRM